MATKSKVLSTVGQGCSIQELNVSTSLDSIRLTVFGAMRKTFVFMTKEEALWLRDSLDELIGELDAEG